MFGVEKIVKQTLNKLFPEMLKTVNKNLHKQGEAKKIILLFDVGKENFENCLIRIYKHDGTFNEKSFDVTKVDFENLTKEDK